MSGPQNRPSLVSACPRSHPHCRLPLYWRIRRSPFGSRLVICTRTAARGRRADKRFRSSSIHPPIHPHLHHRLLLAGSPAGNTCRPFPDSVLAPWARALLFKIIYPARPIIPAFYDHHHHLHQPCVPQLVHAVPSTRSWCYGCGAPGSGRVKLIFDATSIQVTQGSRNLSEVSCLICRPPFAPPTRNPAPPPAGCRASVSLSQQAASTPTAWLTTIPVSPRRPKPGLDGLDLPGQPYHREDTGQ